MTGSQRLLLLLLLPAAYMLGAVPFGLIVGKWRGVDPRTAGSGNIGATNVGRLLGKRFFFLVFLLDMFKGLLPMVVAGAIIGEAGTQDRMAYVLWLLVGFATIIGHMFSIFLGFKGGKGVATSCGVVLGLFPYFTLPALIGLLIWIAIFSATRYVSLGSIVAAICFPIAYVLIGVWRGWDPLGRQVPLLIFALLMATMIVVKHRSNIARLRGDRIKVRVVEDVVNGAPMMTHPAEQPVDLSCHACGYDLRVQPEDGKCPECGASVAESRRLAAIPRRPAWRNSDKRWRRRMLAGAWVLVLLPLVQALNTFGWASSIPVPNPFKFRGGVTLDQTLLCDFQVFESLVFCIGVVLLFSKERGRRASRLDWTRRWGVICSYVVLLLSAAQFLIIAALVLAGIAALFLDIPPQNQPAITQSVINVSSGYLRYGPYPRKPSYLVLIAFSSITILLACAPLWDALRSSGPKWVARILLAPLAFFSLIHLIQDGRYALGFSDETSNIAPYGIYFCPRFLFRSGSELSTWNLYQSASTGAFMMEAAKWGIFIYIAIWLTIAQISAIGRGRPIVPVSARSR